MAAAQTDMFKKTGAGTVTTLAAPGKAMGATSITVGASTNHPTDTGIVIAIRQVDSAGELVAGTYTEWSATVTSGTSFSINAVPVYGSDQVYAAGSTTQVYIPVSSYAHNKLIDGILVEHNQDGTHSDITATTVTADEFIVAGASANNGWTVGLPTPDTVTYNGNRSYDLVFNSNDLTDTVSNGMRTRFTRTVTPPTQCTDLESGSSQYWSKTSPSGISFTTTFTCAGWVKLESYVESGIIARMNGTTEGWSFYITATGQVRLHGRRIAANHKLIESYQSIPLNKWVHVAACIDMTAADTTAQKIWIDGVEVPRAYTLTGTATAIVQGTTALVVGAAVSAGTSPMDGKIAQASVHSACLSDAQIKAMASQTISSSTPSIVSGFTFNGAATDVTANANDLTASGGATYGTDSPFNATEYGIITANSFSTNTTLTVQVPEGYAIPTSGGVSAVAYSTQNVPYGFPRDKGKWRVSSILMTSSAVTSNATYGSYLSAGYALKVPTGAWKVGHSGGYTNATTTTVVYGVSDTALTGLVTGTANEIEAIQAFTKSAAASNSTFMVNVSRNRILTTQTTFTMYTLGATTSALIDGAAIAAEIYAEFNYV